MSQPRRYLPLDGPIERHASLDSTMLRARARLEEERGTCLPGTSVIADAQTRGRGRSGRAWQSLYGFGLYATVMVPLKRLFDGTTLSLIGGFAALRAAQSLVGEPNRARIGLKWPNDVVVSEQKLAGILIELVADIEAGPWALVGLGLNLKKRAFLPHEAAADDGRYIGLNDLMPGDSPHDALALCETSFTRFRAELSQCLKDAQDLGISALLAEIERNHVLIGQEISFEHQGELRFGRAEALGPNGELIVKTQQTSFSLIAGEVQKVRPHS